MPPVVSPVLFMTVRGKPMSFYIHPGALKRKLQPSILAGGGTMCNFQRPGAILLTDPLAENPVPESEAHRYVSTQFILDCIEKNEQLEVEDYRLNSEAFKRKLAILIDRQKNSPRPIIGWCTYNPQFPYTPEEDAAILQFLSKHKADTTGNWIWQEMEKEMWCRHRWASLKRRYMIKLSQKQSEAVDLETTGQDNEAQTEIDDQSIPAESTVGNKDAQTSVCLKKEEEDQQIDQQSEKTAKRKQAETTEAKACDALQTEETDADMDTDTQILTAQATEPERDEPQTEATSPQTQQLPEKSQTAKPESAASQSPGKSRMKEAEPELPQRLVTRRQLESSSSSPEPYSKRFRSSTQADQGDSSPQATNKAGLPKDKTTNETPPKTARGKIPEAAESVQEQSEAAPIAEAPASAPQKEGKKKEKKQLGVLELAAKEFEDESESAEDEAPDLQSPSQTAAMSSETVPPPSDEAAQPATPQTNNEPKPGPKSEPDLQEKKAEPQASRPGTVCPKPASINPTVVEPATSRAHLFIFDSESQEVGSQSAAAAATGDAPSNRLSAVDAPSLTQADLEEDMERIRELMNQTDKDLVSVTKALLKTSGDFAAAFNLLLNPSSVPGPFWNSTDDSFLLSTDPANQQCLQEKYGKEEVAKRIVFLEVGG